MRKRLTEAEQRANVAIFLSILLEKGDCFRQVTNKIIYKHHKSFFIYKIKLLKNYKKIVT